MHYGRFPYSWEALHRIHLCSRAIAAVLILIILSAASCPNLLAVSALESTENAEGEHITRSMALGLIEPIDMLDTSPVETEEPMLSPLEATIRDFADTEWNMPDETELELVRKNSTNNWPEAPILPLSEPPELGHAQDITNATETSRPLSISTTMADSWSGTVLYEDPCHSTAGWTPVSDWQGELPMSKLQTGINLLVDGGRYKSGSIPSDPANSHGPMWIKQLNNPPWLGEGVNLEVVLQHQYTPNKMGDVGVVLYDQDGKIVFWIRIVDAWYGTRSDAQVRYHFLGGGSVHNSVQMSGSWSGTLKIWYEKGQDTIKATLPGGSYTLVNNPSEDELNRLVTHVAIYFANKQNYAYESKFIDYIKVTEETSPITAYPAHPLNPAMEGHWFPKTAYSRLYFQLEVPYHPHLWTYFIGLRIVADQETTYSRMLTVKVNDIVMHNDVISPWSGFDGEVMAYGSGVHKVEIQIHYGAYVEKGWKLLEFSAWRVSGEQFRVLGEYFPQMNPSRLTYQVVAGVDTRISVKMEPDQDPIARTLKVYVDGMLKQQASGSGLAVEWSLGDYPDGSVHEILLELTYGGYAEWGKRLSINRVHRFKGAVEIDYMAGHCPTQEDLNVLRAYYVTMGYDRVEFHIDDEIPFKTYFTFWDDYWLYRSQYRDHTEDHWEWMVFCHYILYNGVSMFGFHLWGDGGIFIADQKLQDLAIWPFLPSLSAYRRTVMMHEYGHHIWIIDIILVDGMRKEDYCPNWSCAMCSLEWPLEYPWYCQHHWSQRRWPGW